MVLTAKLERLEDRLKVLPFMHAFGLLHVLRLAWWQAWLVAEAAVDMDLAACTHAIVPLCLAILAPGAPCEGFACRAAELQSWSNTIECSAAHSTLSAVVDGPALKLTRARRWQTKRC